MTEVALIFTCRVRLDEESGIGCTSLSWSRLVAEMGGELANAIDATIATELLGDVVVESRQTEEPA